MAFFSGGYQQDIDRQFVASWSDTRKSGRSYFVLTRGVAGWGGLMATGLLAGCWLSQRLHPVLITWYVIGSVLGGAVLGLHLWKASEARYAKLAHQADPVDAPE